ncbi:uncharacterized protein LOC129300382 [Prosopis cineraria]|uniref:uncharacterized protein LOC129300382 n=1 Tax=Prosopis cineraria TaxID=364024 RepID=UPI0024101E4F|nr:uncharacterized protein LOC129300382 [Prosopis cineraria]
MASPSSNPFLLAFICLACFLLFFIESKPFVSAIRKEANELQHAHHHRVLLTSFFPSSSCSSQGACSKGSLQVVHKHGPCSKPKQHPSSSSSSSFTMPHCEILKQDAVNSLGLNVSPVLVLAINWTNPSSTLLALLLTPTSLALLHSVPSFPLLQRIFPYGLLSKEKTDHISRRHHRRLPLGLLPEQPRSLQRHRRQQTSQKYRRIFSYWLPSIAIYACYLEFGPGYSHPDVKYTLFSSIFKNST